MVIISRAFTFKGSSKNALFTVKQHRGPRLLRWLRARTLMYALYTVVLPSSGTEVRAVPSRLRAPTFGALTKKLLFLEEPLIAKPLSTKK